MTRHFLAASLALTAALGGVAVSQHKHGNTTAYADLGETERALDALELAFPPAVHFAMDRGGSLNESPS